MRKETVRASKPFALSIIARLLKNVFGRWGRTPGRTSTEGTRASVRRSFALEALEPRLLLSADLSAGATWATDLTVSALDATHVQISDGSITNTTSVALPGDGVINITRTSTSDVLGDTVHLDLTSLAGLSATALTLNFTGGRQTAAADRVHLENTGTLGYDFTINSDAAIQVDAGTSLTATGHAITLAVAESDSGIGIDGHNFAADATHATVTVLGAAQRQRHHAEGRLDHRQSDQEHRHSR